ncbi:2-amino-4-hydroxy-6-hydroxymethyldihydropteridine diphosphokinase, partial [Marinobacter alexandrii]
MADQVRVYISIGSNVDRERYVTAALDALANWFGGLEISPVYESEAVGFNGSPFLNLVV